MTNSHVRSIPSLLRIALVVSGRVPAAKYGGTQRVVPWLARELVRKGHAVTVVAGEGSFVPGARMIVARTPAEALARVPNDIDIAHFHSWYPTSFHVASL